ncbi:Fic family protein [Haploplasma axanthum]|uniref:Fic family protein n=1 Tax=Haploplasma axanthum TaxID=29552 RepID=A0A449BDH1_HAPAX|nr:Fic family protein [Haploplasma axanthum]VEU80475.1 Fic family protein [Haploplasma axanthum]
MEKDLLEMHKNHLKNLMHEKRITDISFFNECFLPAYTYDAVSLEGKSKIPYEEVKKLIKYGEIARFDKREQKEVLNHVNCYNQILKWTSAKKDLTEDMIKDLHEMLMKDILVGGVYRNVNIQILGAIHQPPDYIKVYDRMKKLFSDQDLDNMNYFDKGIYLHAMIAKIHPFLDGNGRLTRLILNFYLIKSGHIPITIPLDSRTEYFNAIDIFKEQKDIMPLKLFIKNMLNKRYEELIDELEVEC